MITITWLRKQIMMAAHHPVQRFLIIIGLCWYLLSSSSSCVDAWTSRTRSRRSSIALSACPEQQQQKNNGWKRRNFLLSTTGATTLIVPSIATSKEANAAAAPPPPPSGRPPRTVGTVDVGGGVDVSIDTSTKVLSDPSNLVFPASLQGRWICQRKVVSVEGDFYQAQSAWKALGGGATNKNTFFVSNAGGGSTSTPPEEYEIHFIPTASTSAAYSIMDRRYEFSSRTKQAINVVQWNQDSPNLLQATGASASVGGGIEIAIVQRSVITPDLQQGIVAGGQELLRISEGPFIRAALIKQRFRQAGSSSNVIEGLEIMKTFRVLDGIAGTEFPTSTTKTQIRFTRIGPLLEEDDVKLVSAGPSSLYFDGSNWY